MGNCWTRPEDRNHKLAQDALDLIAVHEQQVKEWRETVAGLNRSIIDDPMNEVTYRNQIKQNQGWISKEEEKIARIREVHRLITQRDANAQSGVLLRDAARLGERHLEIYNQDEIADALENLRTQGEMMDEVFVDEADGDDEAPLVQLNTAFTRREERRVLLSS